MGNISHIDFCFRGKEKIGIDLDPNANLDAILRSIHKFLKNAKLTDSCVLNAYDDISIIYENDSTYQLNLSVHPGTGLVTHIELHDTSDDNYNSTVIGVPPFPSDSTSRYASIDIMENKKSYAFSSNNTSITRRLGFWVNYEKLPFSVIPSEEQGENDLPNNIRRVRNTLQKKSNVLTKAQRLKNEINRFTPYLDSPLKLIEILSLFKTREKTLDHIRATYAVDSETILTSIEAFLNSSTDSLPFQEDPEH